MNTENTDDLQFTVGKVMVAYHDKCTDGLAAAAVAYSAIKTNLLTSLPMNYSEESYKELVDKMSLAEYSNLYVLDFSIPIETIKEIQKNNERIHITILDHHKTAFENYFGRSPDPGEKYIGYVENALVYLDMNESGASLAYRHFVDPLGEWNLPLFIRYVRDYDLWKFELEYTKELNAVFKEEVVNIATASIFLDDLQKPDVFVSTVKKGVEILKNNEIVVSQLAAAKQSIDIGGYFVYVAVVPHKKYVSRVAESIIEENAFGVAALIDVENNSIEWSLRSRSEFDVSEVARLFNGGGHKNAAGFTTPLSEDFIVRNT